MKIRKKTSQKEGKKGRAERAAKSEKRKSTGIIVFYLLLAIAIILLLKYSYSQYQKKSLNEDANTVLNAVTTNALKIVNSDKVDEDMVHQAAQKGYEQLKSELGIKNDFCIHFEDKDGNIVKIDGLEPGIGSEKVKVGGRPCGQ